MKHLMFAAACGSVFALAGSAAAQDSQQVDISAFDRIDAGGGVHVIVAVGDSNSVRLEGDADDFDRLEIGVRNGELRIDRESRSFFSRNRSIDVVVHVTAPSIESLDFSRGVLAEVSGLDSDELSVDVSTGARADLVGRCGELNLDMSTGSSLDAQALVCENVDADASTGSSGRVFASESIDAGASTGASLRVYGSPSHANVHSSMGGSVRVDRNG